MFMYELGVAEEHRRRGIGFALVEALRELSVELGCYGMWVLTDAENLAAIGAYRAAGGGKPSPQVMLGWTFEATASR